MARRWRRSMTTTIHETSRRSTDQRVGHARFAEALVAENAGVAHAARAAVGLRILAAPRQRQIDPELDRTSYDAGLGEGDERRMDREAALALHAGLGPEVREMLERVDVLGAAVG